MQKKKGISLIVLVITIIVMIVLAGAIILSLNNAGIIERSNEAVKDTDEATAKELAQMAWAEAYADGVRKVEDEGTNKGLKTRVIEALNANKIDTTKYLLNVTTKGVTVKLLAEAWVQEGLIVKKGNDVLNIGQTIKYNAIGTDYEGKEWKVLGADADGNLLIMSAADVKTEYPLGSTTLTTAQSEWLSAGVTKLDAECTPYGKGEGAISARSIRVEDIDRVTGYNKTTYANDSIYQYGNTVTYTYNGTTKPSYKGTNEITGELTTDHTKGFCWYDEKGFHSVTAEELTAETNKGKEIATITSTYYAYVGTSQISADTEAYKMIFGTSDNWNKYWLASTYLNTYTSYAHFGMYRIYEGNVSNTGIWISAGDAAAATRGVRAVVTLSSDVGINSLIQ